MRLLLHDLLHVLLSFALDDEDVVAALEIADVDVLLRRVLLQRTALHHATVHAHHFVDRTLAYFRVFHHHVGEYRVRVDGNGGVGGHVHRDGLAEGKLCIEVNLAQAVEIPAGGRVVVGEAVAAQRCAVAGGIHPADAGEGNTIRRTLYVKVCTVLLGAGFPSQAHRIAVFEGGKGGEGHGQGIQAGGDHEGAERSHAYVGRDKPCIGCLCSSAGREIRPLRTVMTGYPEAGHINRRISTYKAAADIVDILGRICRTGGQPRVHETGTHCTGDIPVTAGREPR